MKYTQYAENQSPAMWVNGWYKEAACTNKWNFAVDIVKAEITLYAGWTAQQTGVEDLSALNIHIYPNPFVDRLHTSGAEGCLLQIFAANGRLKYNLIITKDDEIIQLSHLPAGVYVFRLEKDHQVKTIKVIKEN